MIILWIYIGGILATFLYEQGMDNINQPDPDCESLGLIPKIVMSVCWLPYLIIMNAVKYKP